MKTVLVCGGTHFMGLRLIPALLSKGYVVTMVTRGYRDNPFLGKAECLRADINNKTEIAQLFKGKKYDVIIDNIAFSPGMVLNILDNIETNRYIQVSSMTVYKNTQGILHESLFDPMDYELSDNAFQEEDIPYYEGKRLCEAVAYQLFKNKCPVAIRPGYVVEPSNCSHPGNNRFRWFYNHINNGIPIRGGYGDYECFFTRTDDEADAICLAIEEDITDPVNVGSKGSVRIDDIITCFERAVGKKAVYQADGDVPPFTGTDFEPDSFCGKYMSVKRLESLGFHVSFINEWFFHFITNYINEMSVDPL